MIILLVIFLAIALFMYALCRVSSINKDWEQEDREQAQYIAEYFERKRKNRI